MKKWGIYIAVALAFVVYNAATEADRDSAGAIVGEGNVDAFDIRIGDCFDDTSSLLGGDGNVVNDLPGVPCSNPHDNEVFAVFDLSVTTYPEGDTMGQLAFDSCKERFASFVGTDYDSSSLDITTLYPTSETWNRQNDREVVCAVYDMNAGKLEGSVAGLSL